MNVLQYKFENTNLLQEALTHSSVRKNCNGCCFNYERMEFLGDSILGFVIAEYLFRQHATLSEGELSKRQASLVSRKTCAQVGHKINLANFLILSPGEEKNGGRLSDTNVANAMEAVICAVFLDGTIDAAKKLILRLWKDFFHVDINPDSKTVLQEWSQSKYKVAPKYTTIDITGPDHTPIFKVQVSILKLPPCLGLGKNKKEAEKDAARQLLSMIECSAI